MSGQINIYDYLNKKPPVGCIIHFITCGKIKSAKVISQDASFAGVPFEGYIKVMTKKGEIWRIKVYYRSLEGAKQDLLLSK